MSGPHYPPCDQPCIDCDYDDGPVDDRQQPDPRHPFNPEEVDIGVGIQRGYTCLDCGMSESEGEHG